MKIKLILLVSIIVFSLFHFCFKNPVEPEDQIFFFNSFETKKDTTDWKGIYYQNFVNEPAPDGGKKSVLISGGCIQPTASIDLPIVHKNSKFVMSCWGRVNEDNQSGLVSLKVMDGENSKNSVALNVNTKTWNLYKSEKLICQPGEHLRIEIMIGGIIGASMNLDLLKIERVD